MTDHLQYVTIGVAEDIFAAPVGRVREILDMRRISHLPRAPRTLLGIIDVRGHSVPVVDLRRALDMPELDDTEQTRILVLDIAGREGGAVLGLRADRVIEVTTLDDPVLDPPPSSCTNCGGVAGIGRRNGEFVTVLDLDVLLEDELDGLSGN